MPKHPTLPPFKTKIVRSGGKRTLKHMITIPKPIIESKWDNWKIVRDDEQFIWEPDGLDEILNVLRLQLQTALMGLLLRTSLDKYPLFYLTFNIEHPLNDVSAWNIQLVYVEQSSTVSKVGQIIHEENKVKIVLHVSYEQILKEYREITTSLRDESYQSSTINQRMSNQMAISTGDSILKSVYTILTMELEDNSLNEE
ncbi:MAG: hypothetical protein INQ03_14320 [Candidatus Heimdallarchaeota archaeon]|nr:hypothetical protein [Candidatus Heimdallarchaeota archaeon]